MQRRGSLMWLAAVAALAACAHHAQEVVESGEIVPEVPAWVAVISPVPGSEMPEMSGRADLRPRAGMIDVVVALKGVRAAGYPWALVRGSCGQLDSQRTALSQSAPLTVDQQGVGSSVATIDAASFANAHYALVLFAPDAVHSPVACGDVTVEGH